MTEWVTIRVPEHNRDDAKEIRPDDATHGDCLVAGAKALANGEGGTDKDFEDYFTPDVAQTIAQHVIQDIEINSDTDTSELMDKLRRLDNRLDELPEQTAGKVAERLR